MNHPYNYQQLQKRQHQYSSNQQRKTQTSFYQSHSNQEYSNTHNRGTSENIFQRSNINNQRPVIQKTSYGQNLKDQILSPGDNLREDYSKQKYSPLGNNNNTSFIYNNRSSNLLMPYSSQKRTTGTSYLLPHSKNNKKTLVLDLDETLVHSAFKPFYFKSDINLNVHVDRANHTVHVLKRPYVDQFLERMAQHYEVVVFTASISQYANPLLDQLDRSNVITHRLFREHCVSTSGLYIKDLKRLGRDLKDMIIVDNNPVSYAVNQENGIPILTWHYDKSDTELLKLIPLLEYLAYVDDVRDFITKGVSNNVVNYAYANDLINKSQKEIEKNKKRQMINPAISYQQQPQSKPPQTQSQPHYQIQQPQLQQQQQQKYQSYTDQEYYSDNNERNMLNLSSMNTHNFNDEMPHSPHRYKPHTPAPFNNKKLNNEDASQLDMTRNSQQIKKDYPMSYTPKMNYRNNNNQMNETQKIGSYTGNYKDRKGLRNGYETDFYLNSRPKQIDDEPAIITPNININIVNNNVSNVQMDSQPKKYETIAKEKDNYNPFIIPRYECKKEYNPNNNNIDKETEINKSIIIDNNTRQPQENRNKTIPTSNYPPSIPKTSYQYYNQQNNNTINAIPVTKQVPINTSVNNLRKYQSIDRDNSRNNIIPDNNINPNMNNVNRTGNDGSSDKTEEIIQQSTMYRSFYNNNNKVNSMIIPKIQYHNTENTETQSDNNDYNSPPMRNYDEENRYPISKSTINNNLQRSKTMIGRNYHPTPLSDPELDVYRERLYDNNNNQRQYTEEPYSYSQYKIPNLVQDYRNQQQELQEQQKQLQQMHMSMSMSREMSPQTRQNIHQQQQDNPHEYHHYSNEDNHNNLRQSRTFATYQPINKQPEQQEQMYYNHNQTRNYNTAQFEDNNPNKNNYLKYSHNHIENDYNESSNQISKEYNSYKRVYSNNINNNYSTHQPSYYDQPIRDSYY